MYQTTCCFVGLLELVQLLTEHGLTMTATLKLQYRSKVSYHLSFLISRDERLVSRDESLDSRDESLVSREPLKRIFWNTFQAIGLQENDLFLTTGLPPCTCMLREIPANMA